MIVYDPRKKQEYHIDIDLPSGSGAGLIAAPLFIDLHTHVRYPIFERYDTLWKACTKGGFGICTIQPNTRPRLDRASTLAIHMNASQNLPTTFLLTSSLFGEETSLSIAYSTDGIEYTTSQLWYHLKIHHPKLLMDHSQIYEIEGMFYPNAPYPSIRPMNGEAIAVFRTVSLAIETGWHKIHIQHVSSPYTVKAISYLKEYADITCEITPHHLLIPSEDISSVDTKINPPLAPDRDRKKLVEMTKKGLIDALATDHAPHPKKPEDYKLAPYGSSHVEIAFSAFYTALEDLHLVIDKLTIRPAQILGIDIPPILDNLVIIDPNTTFTVDREQFISLGKNTAFHGKRLKGKILGVKIKGQWIYWDGQLMEVSQHL